jgi:hypothetical protein
LLTLLGGNRARIVLGQMFDVLRFQSDKGAFAGAMILKDIIRFVIINLDDIGTVFFFLSAKIQ